MYSEPFAGILRDDSTSAAADAEEIRGICLPACLGFNGGDVRGRACGSARPGKSRGVLLHFLEVRDGYSRGKQDEVVNDEREREDNGKSEKFHGTDLSWIRT